MMTAPVTNALTIDFEDWYQGLEIPHTQWGRFESRIALAGRRLLEIFADAGVKARVSFKNFDQDLGYDQAPREYGAVRYNFLRWVSHRDMQTYWAGVT